MFPLCDSPLAHSHETQEATVSSISELIRVNGCAMGFAYCGTMFHVNTRISQNVALRLLIVGL